MVYLLSSSNLLISHLHPEKSCHVPHRTLPLSKPPTHPRPPFASKLRPLSASSFIHSQPAAKTPLGTQPRPLPRRLHPLVHRFRRPPNRSATRSRSTSVIVRRSVEPPDNSRIITQVPARRVGIGPLPPQVHEILAAAGRRRDHGPRQARPREEKREPRLRVAGGVHINEVHVRVGASCGAVSFWNLRGQSQALHTGSERLSRTVMRRARPADVEDVPAGIEVEDLRVDAGFAVSVIGSI